MADKLGISRVSYENKKKTGKFTALEAKKMCIIFKVKFDYLFETNESSGWGGEVVEMKVEVIISIAIWICAIVGIIIMHRIAPEQKTYKIWAILDAVTITVLMYYNAIQ